MGYMYCDGTLDNRGYSQACYNYGGDYEYSYRDDYSLNSDNLSKAVIYWLCGWFIILLKVAVMVIMAVVSRSCVTGQQLFVRVIYVEVREERKGGGERERNKPRASLSMLCLLFQIPVNVRSVKVGYQFMQQSE